MDKPKKKQGIGKARRLVVLQISTPTEATGTVNGVRFRARYVNTGRYPGKGKWSYRPDSLSFGERISIGRAIARNEKLTTKTL